MLNHAADATRNLVGPLAVAAEQSFVPMIADVNTKTKFPRLNGKRNGKRTSA